MTSQAENKNGENLEKRVLVLMPTGRDAALVCASLEKAGIEAQACFDAKDLEEKVSHGGGAVLLAEEALQNGTLERLVDSFNNHPVWSDIPVVIFAANAHNSEKLVATVGTRLNATIVERPIRITMLVSAARGALRAREKQYQTRDLLEQLKQSDHQKDLFLATLSHELRTPLNSILGWIQILRGNKLIDAEYGLEVIERNAKVQSELISDILFVSRIITGKLTLNLEPIELIPVIEESIEVVLPSIEAKNIRLSISLDPKIKQINADPERLKQVFWNILSNAAKFTPEGGEINISAFLKDRHIEIEISDSGIGIKPEFLPFVFERFRQADNSYTRKIGGLGLGLAIVRHLVELHNGSVGVKSEGANRGATFTIKLPSLISAQTKSAAGEISDDAPKNSQSLTEIDVLLVEDNDDSREMLAILFEQFNLHTIVAASAAEALKILEQSLPDVIISDIGMPDQDGYELIRQIRRLPPEKGGRIPAIALTGYASLQDRALALEAGYQQHLSKPINVDELVEIVKKLSNKKNY